MLGLAVLQGLLGLATETAPYTAIVPDGPFKAAMFNGFFAVLWLISATLFRAAAKADRKVGVAE